MASIMSEASMKQYFGWTQGSNMAGVYVHMSGKDTDEAVLRASGIERKKEIKQSKLKPIKCLRCKIINEATNRCCKQCGLILDKEYAQEVLKESDKRSAADDIMNKITSNPKALERFKEIIDEIVAENKISTLN